MKIYKWSAALSLSLLLTASFFSQTQTETALAASNYVISAKAGAVNFISGDVSLRKIDGQSVNLTKGLSVEDGEVVTTKAMSRAEILLNPGSFVRLAENSEFQFVSASLDDLRLKLARGAAIFELTAADDFSVTIETPKSVVNIRQTGVYRIDINEDGTAQLEVWKGKVQFPVTGKKIVTVKAGQKIMLGGDALAVVKFDRDAKDYFELWSRDRAKELAKINAKLARKTMNRALAAFSNRSSSWGNGFGLWVNDPFSGYFCFLPFSYYYNSPYGHWYNRSLWNYQIPPQLAGTIATNPTWGNNPPPSSNNPNPVSGQNPGSQNPSAPIDSTPRERPSPIERSPERSGRDVMPKVRDQ